jgi:hypothetical protein
MMMTAYNDDGSDFLGFVRELASINHWNDDTFDSTSPAEKAEMALLETIPEAQELMRELLQRGLVPIKHVRGYLRTPKGSSAVTLSEKAEIEKIIADTQNWIGSSDERPEAPYHRFCSTIPGETIPRDSIAWQQSSRSIPALTSRCICVSLTPFPLHGYIEICSKDFQAMPPFALCRFCLCCPLP